MNEYKILLEILEEVEKFDDIDDFGKLDNRYTVNLKNKCTVIIKQFLTLIESYDITYYEKSMPYKCIASSLLFNWMLNHHVKLNIFIKQYSKFGIVVDDKLEELRFEKNLDSCKYWKGVDIYKKYLFK